MSRRTILAFSCVLTCIDLSKNTHPSWAHTYHVPHFCPGTYMCSWRSKIIASEAPRTFPLVMCCGSGFGHRGDGSSGHLKWYFMSQERWVRPKVSRTLQLRFKGKGSQPLDGRFGEPLDSFGKDNFSKPTRVCLRRNGERHQNDRCRLR